MAKRDGGALAGVHREYRPLVQAALRDGWTIRQGGNSHWRLAHPDRRGIVFIPRTPSGTRTYLNVRAALRRAGVRCG